VDFDRDPVEADVDEAVNHFDNEFARQNGVAPEVLDQGPLGTVVNKVRNVGPAVVGGLMETGGNLLGAGARLVGLPDSLPQGIAGIGADLQEEGRRLRPTNPANVTANTIGSGLQQGIGLVATMGAAAPVVGVKAALGTVPLVMGGIQGGGQGVMTARDMGIESPAGQLGMGAAFGAAEMLAERMGGAGSKALTEAVQRGVAGTLKRAGKTMGSEAVEEPVTGFAQDAATWLGGQAVEDPNRPGFTTTGYELPKLDAAMLERRKQEAIGGAAGGTVFAGLQLALPNNDTLPTNQTPAQAGTTQAPGTTPATAAMAGGAGAVPSTLSRIAQESLVPDLPEFTGELTAEDVQDLEGVGQSMSDPSTLQVGGAASPMPGAFRVTGEGSTPSPATSPTASVTEESSVTADQTAQPTPGAGLSPAAGAPLTPQESAGMVSEPLQTTANNGQPLPTDPTALPPLQLPRLDFSGLMQNAQAVASGQQAPQTSAALGSMINAPGQRTGPVPQQAGPRGVNRFFPASSNQQPGSSILPAAYREATRGSSTQMAPLSSVYAQARLLQPGLTPEAFLAQVQDGYNNGTLYLEGAGTQQEVAQAGLSLPNTPVGTAVRMMPVPQAETPLRNPSERGSGAAMASNSGAAQSTEPSPGGLSEAEAIEKGYDGPYFHARDGVFDPQKLHGIGIHFGTEAQAESRSSQAYFNPNVTSVYLSPKRTERVRDIGDWNDPFEVYEELENRKLLPSSFNEDDTFHDEVMAADNETGLAMIRARLIASGIDALVYQNTWEDSQSSEDSIIALKPDIIHQISPESSRAAGGTSGDPASSNQQPASSLTLPGTPVGTAVRMMPVPQAETPLRNAAAGASNAAMASNTGAAQNAEPSPGGLSEAEARTPITIYRAGDADEVGVKPFSSWTPEKETAVEYQDNPGFGGETLRQVRVDAGNVLKADTTSRRGMRDLAEALGFESETGNDWFDNGWRYPWEESSKVKRALEESEFDAVQYTDDFPVGATTIIFTREPALINPEPSRAAGGTSGNPATSIQQPATTLQSPAELTENQRANEAILQSLGLPTKKGTRVWGSSKVKTALAKLSTDMRYPATTRLMARELSKLSLDNLLLKIEADARLNWAGLYQPFTDGRGELSLNTRTMGRGDLDIGISLVHEALHHATYRNLRSPRTARQKQAKADLEALFKRAKAALAVNGRLSQFDYELSNTDEFITGLFTRADFQAALADIPSDMAPTLGQRVRSVLDEIFRVLAELVTSKAVPPGSVLEASMAATLRLMEDGKPSLQSRLGNAVMTQGPGPITIRPPGMRAVKAYHGTPHTVDKFTTAKIGTGEGAQAYGWGLYFAQGKAVAEQYRDKLSKDFASVSVDGRAFDENNPVHRAAVAVNDFGSRAKAIAQVRQNLEAFRQRPATPRVMAEIQRFEETLSALESANALPKARDGGNLYTVELLPDEADFLDWDKPLSEQSEKVKAALEAGFTAKTLCLSIGLEPI
jgi:hypothetical protein